MMDVQAVEGEPFTYLVKSRTTPGHHKCYLPDSQCSCIGWTTRQKAYKKAIGRDYECAHIKACWQQLKDDIKAKYGTKSK
jgi:hypothetical protein